MGPEFQELRRDPHPILAAGLKIQAPTGDYDPEKLVNVGTNRWGAKAELGYLVKRLRPGFWAALDLNFYKGGLTTVDGVAAGDI